jgi:hypothetical protein
MKKLLSTLFAFAIIFSLAPSVLAQPADAARGPATGEHVKAEHKKKKHHKKKHPQILDVEGKGSVGGVISTSIRSNTQQA